MRNNSTNETIRVPRASDSHKFSCPCCGQRYLGLLWDIGLGFKCSGCEIDFLITDLNLDGEIIQNPKFVNGVALPVPKENPATNPKRVPKDMGVTMGAEIFGFIGGVVIVSAAVFAAVVFAIVG